MPFYRLTAFERSGKKMLDEEFEAENDKLAKEKGYQLLVEKDFSDQTHRCTSSSGKLLLFHR
ncbi:YhzD family protein [Bacillus sp. FJAT-50079]|uniref:YhzD family protein n=1 Tax=Bacillus sp. FJAT-50079 TaxID=2833577 RepID=UPI001BCA5EC3|nr:YhzD family protein [Bacillus sp. FJAT-50079]MBS4210708.1 hypothetical protein [Bacillus sp. FJAT-50079]